MAEIRLREVKPTLITAINKIAADLREKTATGTLEKLVNIFPGMKKQIAQQQAVISQLRRDLQKYQDRENEFRQIVTDYITIMKGQTRSGESMLKKLGTKPRRR